MCNDINESNKILISKPSFFIFMFILNVLMYSGQMHFIHNLYLCALFPE